MAEIDALISKQALQDVNVVGKSLDAVIVRLDKTIQKSKELDGAMTKLNKSTGNFSQKTKKVNAANKQATKINKDLKMAEDDVVKAKLKHQQAVKEQRDRIKQVIAEENKEIGTLGKLRQRNKELAKERNSLNLATEKGQKRLKQINAELDKNNAKIKGSSDAYTKQKINIGNYGSALQSLPGPLGMVAMGITQVTAAAKKFLLTPLGAAIAALALAFGSLLSWMRRTEEGQDALNIQTERFNVILQNILDVLDTLGEKLYNTFAKPQTEAGNFNKAVEKVKTSIWDAVEGKKGLKGLFAGIKAGFKESVAAVKEFGKETKREMAVAQRLAEIENQTYKDERELMIMRAKARAEVAELREKAEQRQKYTAAERVAFLKKAVSIEDKIYQNEYNLAKKRWMVQKERNKLAHSNREDKRKEAELEAQMIQLSEQRDKLQRTMLTKMQTYLREELSDRKAINKLEKADMQETVELQVEREQEAIDMRLHAMKKAYVDEEAMARAHAEIMHEIRLEELGMQIEAVANKMAEIHTLTTAGTDLWAAMQNRQTAKLQKEKERQLALAGDNEKKREKIEERFAKKELEIKRRIAVADKLNALFGITISTARAIAEALPNPVLVAFAAAMGALQLATVAAQPLPGFWKGTRSAPEGYAMVGERGQELMIDPRGNVSLSGDEPHLTYLKRGTQVISNRETELLLRTVSVGGKEMSSVADAISRSNDKVIKAINNKRELHIYPSKKKITERRGNYFTEYLNTKLYE